MTAPARSWPAVLTPLRLLVGPLGHTHLTFECTCYWPRGCNGAACAELGINETFGRPGLSFEPGLRPFRYTHWQGTVIRNAAALLSSKKLEEARGFQVICDQVSGVTRDSNAPAGHTPVASQQPLLNLTLLPLPNQYVHPPRSYYRL